MEMQTIEKTKDSKIVPIAQKEHLLNTGNLLKDEERTRCEVWSRPMGYYRPISHYNIGKKQEFFDRKVFKEPREL